MNKRKIEDLPAAAILGPLLCLVIAGCVSVPSIDADRSAAAQMKRIAILEIHPPRSVQVVNIGGAAGAFGIVGGLVQATTNIDHSKQFAEVLTKQKAPLAETLLTAVEKSLAEDGFKVSVERGQKAKLGADGKSDDYSDIHVDADEIFSIWFSVAGYMSSPYSTHYEPWVVIKARLLDAKTKKDVYYKTICVGYKMKLENAVMLPADARYRYSSFDDLMLHSDDAVAGLLDCEAIAARHIGQDLKK
jgi:hypothetical protein